jgi:hypothetical protein
VCAGLSLLTSSLYRQLAYVSSIWGGEHTRQREYYGRAKRATGRVCRLKGKRQELNEVVLVRLPDAVENAKTLAGNLNIWGSYPFDLITTIIAGLALAYHNQRNLNLTMAENAPLAGASNAASDAARGMPYYERLRRDLRESLQKKRMIDSNLVCTLPGDAYVRVALTGASGANRRQHRPHRNIVSRRNSRREHRQGLRQLHQGRSHDRGGWRCRRCDASESPNQ